MPQAHMAVIVDRVVPRGDYTQLPALMVVVLAIGFIAPLAAILALGRKLR